MPPEKGPKNREIGPSKKDAPRVIFDADTWLIEKKKEAVADLDYFMKNPSISVEEIRECFKNLAIFSSAEISERYGKKLPVLLSKLLWMIEADWESKAEHNLRDHLARIKVLQYLLLFTRYPMVDSSELLLAINEADTNFIAYCQKNKPEVEAYLAESLTNAVTRDNLFKSVSAYSSADDARKVLSTRERHLDLLTLANPKVVKNSSANLFSEYFINEDGGWTFDSAIPIGAIKDDPLISVIASDDPETRVLIPFSRLRVILENDSFVEFAKKIRKDCMTEKHQQEQLRRFDLPRDSDIAYLRIFPREFDLFTSSAFSGSSILADALHSRYPNVSVQPPILTDSPKNSIIENIRTLYAGGTRNFFLDLYSHGSTKRLEFSNPLKASDLTAIANEFPDANFTISTVACFGGGLRRGILKEFSKNPAMRHRLSVHLQTKPGVVNVAGFMRTNPDKTNVADERMATKDSEKSIQHLMTIYHITLIRALNAGKTFGEALVEADRASKMSIETDPENIIGGELYTENIGDKGSDERTA